tara:strand:+ start:1130 stop:2317 length:1188 start_codon:yes stop_codon:yes gene_type:complete
MALTTSLSALTRDKFIPVLVDNIFNSNVLTFKLLKNAEKLDGGVKIVTPIENLQNSQHGWIGSGGNTYESPGHGTTVEVATKAEWDWATAYETIVIEGDINYKNRGSSQVLSLLKAKLKNAEKSMKDLFGTGLFNASMLSNGLYTLNGTGVYDGGGGGSSGAQAQAHDNGNGLIHDASGWTGSDAYYIPEGAVANSIVGYDRSVGGIDSGTPGTNDFWNANTGSFVWAIGKTSAGATLNVNGSDDFQTVDIDKFCTTTSGIADGVKAMTKMYGACTVDNDMPDLIVTTQAVYDAYESALQANKRFTGNSEMADAGFQSLQFKGASVVVDSHVPAGQMYFLNTNYLDFKVHSQRNFQFEDFKALEQMDKIQARMFWMGQVVCTNPRMQGVLVGGPT